MQDSTIIDIVKRHAVPADLESAGQRLFESIDPAVSLVPVGDATHGTLEFYRIRADVTRYFAARLPQQFNLVMHVDRTRAVEPLERWSRHEVDLPETYPTGV